MHSRPPSPPLFSLMALSWEQTFDRSRKRPRPVCTRRRKRRWLLLQLRAIIPLSLLALFPSPSPSVYRPVLHPSLVSVSSPPFMLASHPSSSSLCSPCRSTCTSAPGQRFSSCPWPTAAAISLSQTVCSPGTPTAPGTARVGRASVLTSTAGEANICTNHSVYSGFTETDGCLYI